MSREIPFFELFAQLQLSPELRLKLLGAVIASACIHQDTLSMELAMIEAPSGAVGSGRAEQRHP